MTRFDRTAIVCTLAYGWGRSQSEIQRALTDLGFEESAAALLERGREVVLDHVDLY